MVSSDGYLSRNQPYSQRILEISLPHRSLSQNDRKYMGRGYLTSAWKKFWQESVVECDIEESETVSTLWSLYSTRLCLAKIRGVEVNSNDIDELVAEYSTEELMELHCVSQQVITKSLTEEEVVTAKQNLLTQ
ncbi:hypothetical protein AVEN_158945-1 [Araneus ventricosus]|uniref:Uncharacterized protein n=1 Tax=Araneus ventricosus TaxID=182803 RepID=A0A4Y2BBJ7_ARAVE|nr:hypothetical protein AVEN_158945-1 [Araneus ventricosus]